MKPADVVASFDSASVLHKATVAALRGRSFRHLGNSESMAAAVRVAGELPWPILRRLYTRIGAAEGIPVRRLRKVDMSAVASSFADAYPERRYPAIMIGSSNGAMAHLAAGLQIPWLPDTVLVPVAHTGRRDHPDDAMAFGTRVAPPLLDANPDIVLHHMHDPVQDALMSREMTYFRVKWTRLPEAYVRFVADRLAPGGRILLIDDRSTWPVTRVGERHVFQVGGQGGVAPEDLLSRPRTPPADEEGPESEWGLPPAFRADAQRRAAELGLSLSEISYSHPQDAAGPVADVLRLWYRQRGEPAQRLVLPSFILCDPWTSVDKALVPYWTFFSVQPALRAVDSYLSGTEPYDEAHVFLFEHGVWSEGIATPDEFCSVVRAHGATAEPAAMRGSKFPHDIGSLARYAAVFDRFPPAVNPWSPLEVDVALEGLRSASGVTVVDHLVDPSGSR